MKNAHMCPCSQYFAHIFREFTNAFKPIQEPLKDCGLQLQNCPFMVHRVLILRHWHHLLILPVSCVKQIHRNSRRRNHQCLRHLTLSSLLKKGKSHMAKMGLNPNFEVKNMTRVLKMKYGKTDLGVEIAMCHLYPKYRNV